MQSLVRILSWKADGYLREEETAPNNDESVGLEVGAWLPQLAVSCAKLHGWWGPDNEIASQQHWNWLLLIRGRFRTWATSAHRQTNCNCTSFRRPWQRKSERKRWLNLLQRCWYWQDKWCPNTPWLQVCSVLKENTHIVSKNTQYCTKY